MKPYLFILLFFIAQSSIAQEYFTVEDWNFRIKKVSDPFVFQDENYNFTASFDLEDKDMLLVEVYPKDRDCSFDSLCLHNEMERVILDIKNQDRRRFDPLKMIKSTPRIKNGFNGIHTIFSGGGENAIIDIYVTEGFVYALSLTTKNDPSKYIEELNSFEFLRELKEHGKRSKEFQEKKDAIRN